MGMIGPIRLINPDEVRSTIQRTYPKPSETTRSHDPVYDDLPPGVAAAVEARLKSIAPRNIHNDPSIVNRLIRLVEELIERDDVRMHADMAWYGKQLGIIKKEMASAEQELLAGGQGEAQENCGGSAQEE